MHGDALAYLVPTYIHVQAARNGVEDLIIGMPHRGRLNVMANILDKPVEHTIKEFQEEVGVLVSASFPLRHGYCVIYSNSSSESYNSIFCRHSTRLTVAVTQRASLSPPLRSVHGRMEPVRRCQVSSWRVFRPASRRAEYAYLVATQPLALGDGQHRRTRQGPVRVVISLFCQPRRRTMSVIV